MSAWHAFTGTDRSFTSLCLGCVKKVAILVHICGYATATCYGYATATFLAVMLPLISGGYATAYLLLILAAFVILFSIHNL